MTPRAFQLLEFPVAESTSEKIMRLSETVADLTCKLEAALACQAAERARGNFFEQAYTLHTEKLRWQQWGSEFRHRAYVPEYRLWVVRSFERPDVWLWQLDHLSIQRVELVNWGGQVSLEYGKRAAEAALADAVLERAQA